MADNNDGDNNIGAAGGEGVPQPPENDSDNTYVAQKLRR
jgi:hypothetical protein